MDTLEWPMRMGGWPKGGGEGTGHGRREVLDALLLSTLCCAFEIGRARGKAIPCFINGILEIVLLHRMGKSRDGNGGAVAEVFGEGL